MWLLPTANPPPCWQRRTDGTDQKDALNPDDPPEKSGRATPESWRHGRSSLQGSLLPRKKSDVTEKNTTAIGGSQDRTKTLGILLVFQQSQFLAPQRAIPMCGNWQLRALAPTEQKPTKIGHLAGQNGPRRCNRSERGPLLHGWSACCTLAALHESTLCSRNMATSGRLKRSPLQTGLGQGRGHSIKISSVLAKPGHKWQTACQESGKR